MGSQTTENRRHRTSNIQQLVLRSYPSVEGSNSEVRMGSCVISFRVLLTSSVLSSLLILVANPFIDSTVSRREAIDFFLRSTFPPAGGLNVRRFVIFALAPPGTRCYVRSSGMSECQPRPNNRRSPVNPSPFLRLLPSAPFASFAVEILLLRLSNTKIFWDIKTMSTKGEGPVNIFELRC